MWPGLTYPALPTIPTVYALGQTLVLFPSDLKHIPKPLSLPLVIFLCLPLLDTWTDLQGVLGRKQVLSLWFFNSSIKASAFYLKVQLEAAIHSFHCSRHIERNFTFYLRFAFSVVFLSEN